jgi:hypothetical protein
VRRPALPCLLAAVLAAVLASALASCRSTDARTSDRIAAPAQARQTVILEGVPHVRQKPDFCGEADVEMFLRYRGKNITQDQVFGLSGMAPERGMGATTTELSMALDRLGIHPGRVWHPVARKTADAEIDRIFDDLVADLGRKVPSIVCMRTSAGPEATEHFRLVVGYDAVTDEVVYHEPAEDGGAYRRMPRTTLYALWPLKYERDKWTVIRLRLEAKEIRDPAPETGFSKADFAQHVRALLPKVPRGFTVMIEPPFVVIGNGPREHVAHWAEGTVRWTVRMLKQDFFTRDPARILDVWAIEGKTTYHDLAFDLVGYYPTTPYGFYSDEHGALIMNINTGGGTLVHEIVHPFIEANFPACPSWFNEGLGSLYEQSDERDGHIIGKTNWRLGGLQDAIRRGALPSFRDLTRTTQGEFYNADRGSNYAQSRYLLYWLQEHALLVRYYREFIDTAAADATGYDALVRVLGEKDMAAFQKRWEKDVLALRFERGG